MKKNGFTLVELIGTVIVLGLIAILAFPTITNLIRGTQEDLDEATKILIYTAAKSYVGDYKNEFIEQENATYCIELRTLVQKEYLVAPVIDAKGNEMALDKLIEAKYINNKFEFNLNQNCTE